MPKPIRLADTVRVMSDGDNQPNQTAQADLQAAGGSRNADEGLADIRVPFEQAKVVEVLGQAARRGKLPEFAKGGPENALFRASALGQPFDRDLVAWAAPDEGGTKLSFQLRWRKKSPILFIAALIFTVEPGRYFLEMMIPGSRGWGSIIWRTYPLAYIPIPFAWRTFMKQSRKSTMESAQESHAAIQKILAGATSD